MARTLELLLTENVEGSGIVGDVVKVRKGFARNFLLPRGYATTPSEEKIAQLKGKREEAQRELAEIRRQREALIAKLQGHEVALIRSCNDQGILYGGVTQQDLCDLLAGQGHVGIKQRDVRIGSVIKRVGEYEVHIKFEAELEASIKLHVKPDRKLDIDDRRDAEKPADAVAAPAGEAGAAATTAPEAKTEAKTDGKPAEKAKGDKPKAPKAKAEGDAPDAPAPAGEKAEKAAKPKGEKGGKGKDGADAAAPATNKSKTGWGTVAEVPAGLSDLLKPKRERRERR